MKETRSEALTITALGSLLTFFHVNIAWNSGWPERWAFRTTRVRILPINF